MSYQLPPPPEGRFGKWAYQLWDYVARNRVGAAVAITGSSPITVGTGTAGTFTVGHAVSGVTAGTFGTGNVWPQVVVDVRGHLTAATAGGTLGTFAGFNSFVGAGDLLGTTTTNTFTGALSTTGVIAGTYTNATVAVDAKGRVTLATNGAASVSSWNTNLNTLTTGTQTTAANQNLYLAGGFYVKGTNVCLYVSSSGRVAIR